MVTTHTFVCLIEKTYFFCIFISFDASTKCLQSCLKKKVLCSTCESRGNIIRISKSKIQPYIPVYIVMQRVSNISKPKISKTMIYIEIGIQALVGNFSIPIEKYKKFNIIPYLRALEH